MIKFEAYEIKIKKELQRRKKVCARARAFFANGNVEANVTAERTPQLVDIVNICG